MELGPRTLLWELPGPCGSSEGLGSFGPILSWLRGAVSGIPSCRHVALFLSASRAPVFVGADGLLCAEWRFSCLLATMSALGESSGLSVGFALETISPPGAASSALDRVLGVGSLVPDPLSVSAVWRARTWWSSYVAELPSGPVGRPSSALRPGWVPLWTLPPFRTEGPLAFSAFAPPRRAGHPEGPEAGVGFPLVAYSAASLVALPGLSFPEAFLAGADHLEARGVRRLRPEAEAFRRDLRRRVHGPQSSGEEPWAFVRPLLPDEREAALGYPPGVTRGDFDVPEAVAPALAHPSFFSRCEALVHAPASRALTHFFRPLSAEPPLGAGRRAPGLSSLAAVNRALNVAPFSVWPGSPSGNGPRSRVASGAGTQP